MRFSDHFKLAKSQAELDFVDIPLETDIALFVDPYAFSIEEDEWFIEGNNLVVDYFQRVIDSIRTGNTRLAQQLLAHLHEPNDTHLGLSGGRPAGRGIGQLQSNVLYTQLSKSEAVRTGKLHDLSDCELLIPGIGSDKISDITVNIIRGKLVEYTEKQCALLGIPTHRVGSGMYWDSDRTQWANRYAHLPIYKGRRIVLVPKAAVRFKVAVDHKDYYRNFVLNYLQFEHLRGGTALVHLLKNGKRRVYKKDLEKMYPLDKEYLAKFSDEHPEVLEQYKKSLRRKTRTIKNEEIEQLQAVRRKIEISRLIDDLDDIPATADAFDSYAKVIVGVLESIFYPSLRRPQKEQATHDGQQRLGVVYTNGADQGFFYDLKVRHKIPCSYIHFECNNRSCVADEDELIRLTERFNENLGKFGIFLCREVQNKDAALEICRELVSSDRGFVLVLDDEDITALLQLRDREDFSGINDYLNEKLKQVSPDLNIPTASSTSREVMTRTDKGAYLKLTGLQREKLSNAIRGAFNKQRLEEMLSFKLNKRLDDITLSDDFRQLVFKVIQTSELEGWTAELIVAARESNPGNHELFEVAQQIGLAPATPPVSVLESIILKTNKFLDVNTWLTRLTEIESQVCRIEIKIGRGTAYGTGFLVGTDTVMTNYHVMRQVIENNGATPSDVILRFDFKQLADGRTINPGTEFRLSMPDWLIDSSPPSSVGALPNPEQLDYALIRVDGSPGSEPVGERVSSNAGLRGWIKIPDTPYDFQPDTTLYIVQHPQGTPLKLAIESNAIIKVNANGTRVQYRTNTEPGSSGSPCFNSDWELVALHHSGDALPNPSYNEGTPISAIMALLEQRNLKSILG
jgi:hypothetical protein